MTPEEEYASKSIYGFLEYYQITNDEGKLLDFKDHPYLWDIYGDFSPILCCEKAAQVGFSTMSNIKALWLAKYKDMNIIYSLPSANDIRLFVGAKTNRLIANNPIFQQWTNDKDSIDQKKVGGSIIYFRGTRTETTALFASADLYAADEVDRSDQAIVKQYQTRLQASQYQWRWYFSNPSIPGVGVDEYWERSDQKHWFVQCDCGHDQYLTMENIKQKEGHYYFGCTKCSKELNRRYNHGKSRWVKKWKDRTISGYWISLLMNPKVSADEIMAKKKEYTDDQFANFVLGQPYLVRGAKLMSQMFFQNLVNQVNPQDSRPIIGVDTGININYVVGNKYGLFFNAKADDYSDLEKLMIRWPTAIMIIDAGGDYSGPKKLKEQFPGRVFSCFFRADQKNDKLVTWKDDDFTVVADRDKLIQVVADELTERRIPLYGTQDDWYDVWLEWDRMRRVENENALGNTVYHWEKTPGQRSDYPFCFSGDTLVSTNKGQVAIRDIRIGDLVLTRKGYRKVTWSGCTGNKDLYDFKTDKGEVCATRNHKFWNGNTFDIVNVDDTIYTCKRNTNTLMDTHSSDTQNHQKETIESISMDISKVKESISIGTYIAQELVKFLKDFWFIIKTAIRSIILFPIYPLCLARNISLCTQRSYGGLLMTKSDDEWYQRKQKRNMLGIGQKKEEKLYQNEQRINLEEVLFVNSVGKKPQSKMPEQQFAQSSVEELSIQENGEPLIRATKLNTIDYARKDDVYDIEVEEEHEFFANGFLVHNCFVYWRIGMARFLEEKVSFHDPSTDDFAFPGMEVEIGGGTRFNPRVMF